MIRFALLRLTGARLGTLRRVVVLETAVPLLARITGPEAARAE